LLSTLYGLAASDDGSDSSNPKVNKLNSNNCSSRNLAGGLRSGAEGLLKGFIMSCEKRRIQRDLTTSYCRNRVMQLAVYIVLRRSHFNQLNLVASLEPVFSVMQAI
jgi:hypothetical protein